MKRFRLFFVFFVIATACSEEPGPAGPFLLTVNIDPNVDSNRNEWIFVSDKDGKLVESREIKAAQKIQFISDLSLDSVTLTVVYELRSGPSQSIYFYSYAGIPAGSELSIKAPEHIPYDHALTEVNVNVSRYTDVRQNRELTASNAQSYVSLKPNDGQHSAQLTGYTAPFPILLSGYTTTNVPSYMLLESGGAEVSVDFTNFKPFPKTISLPAAENISGTLFAHKTWKASHFGYLMSLFQFDDTEASPAVVGYLENYALYDFRYSAFKTLNDRVYVIDYLKRGPINTDLQIPIFEYGVTSINPREAIVTATHPYTAKISYYNNHLPSDNDFRWQVQSPNGVLCRITEIPSMILEKYPNLSLDTFEYNRSIFFRWVDGTTYAQLVDRELQSIYDLPTYEYYMFFAFE